MQLLSTSPVSPVPTSRWKLKGWYIPASFPGHAGPEALGQRAAVRYLCWTSAWAPREMPREKGNAQLLLDGIPDLNAQQLPLWLAKTCAHLLRGFVTGGTEFCQLQENSGFPPKYKFGEGKKKKKGQRHKDSMLQVRAHSPSGHKRRRVVAACHSPCLHHSYPNIIQTQCWQANAWAAPLLSRTWLILRHWNCCLSVEEEIIPVFTDLLF